MSQIQQTDLQVALRTENQKIKLSSPIKPVVNQNEKASELNRNKSQVFYLTTDVWLLFTLKLQRVSNRKMQQRKLGISAEITRKSVNKPKYSHVKETDLQVALRTENQKIKLSSPIKPVVNQNEKASELNRNKSQVFYLEKEKILKKHKVIVLKAKTKVLIQKQGRK